MSKKLVVMGAKLACSQGSAQSSLTVLQGLATAGDKPLATVMDFAPIVNIAPFAMCKTPSNPQVASATAAAAGVLTPVPCMPIPTGPWSPGSELSKVDDVKLLTEDSTCKCQWAGEISITDTGTDYTTD